MKPFFKTCQCPVYRKSGPILYVGDSPGTLAGLFKRARIERDPVEWENCQREEVCSVDQAAIDLKPKVIVTLGNNSLTQLTGHHGITRYRGFVLDGPGGVPLIPTFHPNYLIPRRGELSSAKWTGAVIWDLLKAEKIAREGFTRAPVDYVLDSPIGTDRFVRDYLDALRANPLLPLAWDIETPGKLSKKDEDEVEEIDYTIVRVSFAFRPRYALTVPWQPRWMEAIKVLLGTSGPKIGWNDALFDRPVVRANGVEVNGPLHDAMNAWHVLQPALPKKLEMVASFYAEHMQPWKHLSKSDPEFYSAADADGTICNWIGIENGLRGVRVPEYGEKVA